MSWLAHVLGLDDSTGPLYLWWSGAGAVVLPGLPPALILYLRHNCHTRRCWRLGRHQVPGTLWVVCARHHPEDPPSIRDIAESQESP